MFCTVIYCTTLRLPSSSILQSLLLLQAEYWHFGAEPCIVELQSFFCIFEGTISNCLRISWRSMPKPCGCFKIQDGRQDGRRITKYAITSIIIDLELRIWCLLICFGWQEIHLCGLFYG